MPHAIIVRSAHILKTGVKGRILVRGLFFAPNLPYKHYNISRYQTWAGSEWHKQPLLGTHLPPQAYRFRLCGIRGTRMSRPIADAHPKGDRY